MSLLYHYTTQAAAEQIVRTRQWYFTYFLDLNDGQQIDKRLRHICEQIAAATDNEKHAIGIQQLIYNSYPKDIYIGCFSTAPDCKKMWRQYGKNGVRITVDKSKLCNFVGEPFCQYMGSLVMYGMGGFKRHVEENLKNLVIPNLEELEAKIQHFPFKELEAKKSLLALDSEYMKFRKDIGQAVSECMLSKDTRFSYEKEYRLISSLLLGTSSGEHITFKGKRRSIISFPKDFIVDVTKYK